MPTGRLMALPLLTTHSTTLASLTEILDEDRQEREKPPLKVYTHNSLSKNRRQHFLLSNLLARKPTMINNFLAPKFAHELNVLVVRIIFYDLTLLTSKFILKNLSSQIIYKATGSGRCRLPALLTYNYTIHVCEIPLGHKRDKVQIEKM